MLLSAVWGPAIRVRVHTELRATWSFARTWTFLWDQILFERKSVSSLYVEVTFTCSSNLDTNRTNTASQMLLSNAPCLVAMRLATDICHASCAYEGIFLISSPAHISSMISLRSMQGNRCIGPHARLSPDEPRNPAAGVAENPNLRRTEDAVRHRWTQKIR